jgi:hypothetical protein
VKQNVLCVTMVARKPWNQISHGKWLSIDNCFTIKYFIYIYDENKFTTINHVGKMCVAAMGLCMIVLIATRKEEMVDIILPCDRSITTLLLNCYYQNLL